VEHGLKMLMFGRIFKSFVEIMKTKKPARSAISQERRFLAECRKGFLDYGGTFIMRTVSLIS
jgi:hypothetical protein